MTDKQVIDVHQRRLETVLRVHTRDLNVHQTVFGGHLLGLADELPAILARRLTGRDVATATFDQVNFWEPFTDQEDLILESFITGVTGRAVETFTIIWGEDMYHQVRKLGFSCFNLYVVLDKEFAWDHSLILKGTTPLERSLISSFEQRQATRLLWRDTKRDLISGQQGSE